MNEEIKTTASFLDEALTGVDTDTITVEGDINVDLYTPEEADGEAEATDTNSADTDELEDLDDTVTIDLVSGPQLSMKYNDMDWGKIWTDNYEDMFNNVLAIMAMKRDMVREAPGEKRNELALGIIDVVKRSFQEIGVPEIDMSAYIFETKVEEADMYLEDYLRLIPEIMHISQVDTLMRPTDGMSFTDMLNQLSSAMKDYDFGNKD